MGSSWFCLPVAGIKDVCNHTQPSCLSRNGFLQGLMKLLIAQRCFLHKPGGLSSASRTHVTQAEGKRTEFTKSSSDLLTTCAVSGMEQGAEEEILMVMMIDKSLEMAPCYITKASLKLVASSNPLPLGLQSTGLCVCLCIWLPPKAFMLSWLSSK